MRYHWLSALSIFAPALLGCLANPLPSPWGEMLVKHKWPHIPDNWVTLSHPPDDATIDLHIALKPHRENALINALQEVSQPGHPKYGAYLTKEQVTQLVAPHNDTLELISSWLKYNGVPPSSISATHGGGWLTVLGVPVSRANKLLGASYQLYYHSGTNETILRTVGYALPAALHKHVQTIAPTTAFTSTRLLQSSEAPRNLSGGAAKQVVNATSGEPVNMLLRRQLEDQKDDMTPSVLRSLYGTEEYSPVAVDRNFLGIAGYSNEIPNLVDLVEFMVQFRTDAFAPAAFPIIEAIDDRYRGIYGMEANLDTQYPLALTFPTQIIYYRGSGHGVQLLPKKPLAGPGDQYLEWLNHMLKKRSIPQTVAMGYSTPEPSIPPEYALALCDLFAQFGARGVSILVASGNYGVGHGNCKDVYGNTQFYTTFPSSCPWVTSVGGTKLNAPDYDSESVVEVANNISGGGFSAYFPRHSYQNERVAAYLRKLNGKYGNLFNPRGRGIPDIALQSSEYEILTSGRVITLSGTSCSTHTAAAVISLLNDYLLSKGKPTLGFLNPWLYDTGWLGFNDITSGENPGCNADGFHATVGWDPVTGLGSPNFKMLQGVLDLDNSGGGQLPPVQP